MNDFVFYSPTEFIFGKGVTDQVGERIAKRGYKRALLVYGKGSVVRTGTLDRVKKSLAASGVETVELAGVRPNPEVGLVRKGIELARKENVDVIFPVGGGSAIDCAKRLRLACLTKAMCGTSSARRRRLRNVCLSLACSLFLRRVPKGRARVLFPTMNWLETRYEFELVPPEGGVPRP